MAELTNQALPRTTGKGLHYDPGARLLRLAYHHSGAICKPQSHIRMAVIVRTRMNVRKRAQVEPRNILTRILSRSEITLHISWSPLLPTPSKIADHEATQILRAESVRTIIRFRLPLTLVTFGRLHQMQQRYSPTSHLLGQPLSHFTLR